MVQAWLVFPYEEKYLANLKRRTKAVSSYSEFILGIPQGLC